VLAPRPTRIGVSTFARSRASYSGRVERGAGPLIDEVMIREFLHTAYPKLVAALTLAVGSRAAAEDAVQEALARERSRRGLEIASLPAWVTAVSLNLGRSWIRRMAAERRARSRLGRLDSDVRGAEEQVDLTRALAVLPRLQREVTVLRYYLGMDVREIAGVTRPVRRCWWSRGPTTPSTGPGPTSGRST
jgi:hypothetical protein